MNYRRGGKRADDEELSPIEYFRKHFFEYLIDVTLNSLTERFVALKNHNDLFSFLYDISKFRDNDHSKTLRTSVNALRKR